MYSTHKVKVEHAPYPSPHRTKGMAMKMAAKHSGLSTAKLRGAMHTEGFDAHHFVTAPHAHFKGWSMHEHVAAPGVKVVQGIKRGA